MSLEQKSWTLATVVRFHWKSFFTTYQNKFDQLIAFEKHNRLTFNIRNTLIGNKFIDHSVVIDKLPIGADPAISSFST